MIFYLKNAQWNFLPKVLKKVFKKYNGNFFSRFLKETTMEISFQCFKNTMEISSQGFEKVFENDAQTMSHWACQFGKQYGLVLIITNRTKPEILGHIVHFVFVRSSSS